MSRLRGPFFPQKKVNTGLEIGNEFCNSVRKQCNQKGVNQAMTQEWKCV